MIHRLRAIGALLCAAACTVASVAANAAHPDFTGVWGTYRVPGQPPAFRPQARADLPMRPEAKAKVDAYRALITPSGDSPGGWCLGSGMPASMLGSGAYPMEIVQRDDVILIVYEAHTETRHVYLQQRAKEEDLFPDRNGYSIGRWEGDKLIVETTHLKEAVDQMQYAHSASAKVVEEYTMQTNPDGSKVLTAQMTLTDPEFYTDTIRAEKKWSYLPGIRLLPYECNESTWEDRLNQLRQQLQAKPR